MRFLIKHEVQGRLRIHVIRNRMTCTEADVLCWALEKQKSVIKVKVYERTADAVIYYTGDREELIHKLKKFHFEKADVPDNVLSSSGRALNSAYREKLIAKTLLHYGGKLLLPNSVRKIWLTFKVVQYIGKGIRCLARRKIEVPVLDATAIGVSVLRGPGRPGGPAVFEYAETAGQYDRPGRGRLRLPGYADDRQVFRAHRGPCLQHCPVGGVCPHRPV